MLWVLYVWYILDIGYFRYIFVHKFWSIKVVLEPFDTHGYFGIWVHESLWVVLEYFGSLGNILYGLLVLLVSWQVLWVLYVWYILDFGYS